MTTRLFINEKQQRRLADLLEACPTMMRQRDRNLVIGQLAREIRRQIEPEGKPANVIMEMVAACANYTDATENLIRAVAAFEGDSSVSMGTVWDDLPKVLGFPDEEIHETIARFLKNFTSDQLNREAMEEAFNSSISSEYKIDLCLPRTKFMCRWWMLREMANAPMRKKGGFPFAEYAKRIFHDISDSGVASALVRWAAFCTGEPTASFWGARKASLDNHTKKQEKPHFVVRLLSNPSKPEKYKATFHLHWEGSHKELPPDMDWLPIRNSETTPCVNTIEKILDKTLHLNFDADTIPIAIEVMIRVGDLMSLEPLPHLWCLEEGRAKGHGEAMGDIYPVYLRLDRHERPVHERPVIDEDEIKSIKTPADQPRDWRQKWDEFKNAASTPDCIEWEHDATACTYLSLKKKLCKDKAKPCLMMAFKPEIPMGDAWLDEVLLASGVPVALWGNARRADIEKELLSPLLEDYNLLELPDYLYKMRKGTVYRGCECEYNRDDNDMVAIFHRLTLLWDNPEHDIRKRGQGTNETHHYDMNVLS